MTAYTDCVQRLQQALCEGRLADFASEFAQTGVFSYVVVGYGVELYISGATHTRHEVPEHAQTWLSPVSQRQLLESVAAEPEVDRSPTGKYAGEFKDGEHYMTANFTYGGMSAVDGRRVVCRVVAEATLTDDAQVIYMQVSANITLA